MDEEVFDFGVGLGMSTRYGEEEHASHHQFAGFEIVHGSKFVYDIFRYVPRLFR